MRGERRLRASIIRRRSGSSPHARGTLDMGIPHCTTRRFIPACAGNAWDGPPFRPSPSVHPRMRGERPNTRRGSRYRRGSSPHARGTLGGNFIPVDYHRFIPACAGNALAEDESISRRPVHPRMRGERRIPGAEVGQRDGSSPHARGTQVALVDDHPVKRFIPACAGNAVGRRTRRGSRSVHPRMRGERRAGPGAGSRPVGSSPHARGTRL